MSDLRGDLTALVDGELAADQREALEAAIAEDSELAQDYRDAAAVAQVLRTEMFNPPVTGFVETLSAIRAGSPQTAEAKANRPWVLVGQFAVVATIGGLFMFSAFWNVNPPASDRNVASLEKSVDQSPFAASNSATAAAPQAEAFASRNAMAAGGAAYTTPPLGPVLPPSQEADLGSIVSRAPGSGERPLLALKDPENGSGAGGTSTPPPFRGIAGNIPTEVFPLEVEPLPSVSGAAGDSMPMPLGAGTPGSLATLESAVRILVTSAKGSITGTSRTPDGSRIVITVDEATAESLTKDIESALGANVSVEPVSLTAPALASPKAAVAARAMAKSEVPDAELTVAQLEKRLADQQAKREELLKDFYEDAKPVRSLDAEIQDTKSQIERKKRAAKANKLSFIVILKPVKR